GIFEPSFDEAVYTRGGDGSFLRMNSAGMGQSFEFLFFLLFVWLVVRRVAPFFRVYKNITRPTPPNYPNGASTGGPASAPPNATHQNTATSQRAAAQKIDEAKVQEADFTDLYAIIIAITL